METGDRFIVTRASVTETGSRFTVPRPSVMETGGRFTVTRTAVTANRDRFTVNQRGLWRSPGPAPGSAPWEPSKSATEKRVAPTPVIPARRITVPRAGSRYGEPSRIVVYLGEMAAIHGLC
jgi:hypothetical protein